MRPGSWDPKPEPEQPAEKPVATWSNLGGTTYTPPPAPPAPEPEKKPEPPAATAAPKKRKPPARVTAAREVAKADARVEKAVEKAEDAADALATLEARRALRADPEGADAVFIAKIRKAADDTEKAAILEAELWQYRSVTDAVTPELVERERARLTALVEAVVK